MKNQENHKIFLFLHFSYSFSSSQQAIKKDNKEYKENVIKANQIESVITVDLERDKVSCLIKNDMYQMRYSVSC